MRRDRYAALPREVGVIRTARIGGGFLPDGHLLPKPEWLEPNKEDQADAKVSGRAPGISVWEVPGAQHVSACWIREVDDRGQRSFVAGVDSIQAVASTHARELGVVADPLDHPAEDDRWMTLTSDFQQGVRDTADKHSLIEGIKRPAGMAEKEHRSFREELARAFSLFSDAS